MHMGLMHLGAEVLWESPLTSWGSHCLPESSGSPVNPGKCFSGKWERRKRRGGWRRTRSRKRCAFLRRQPRDWASQQFNKKRCFKNENDTSAQQILHKRWGFCSEHSDQNGDRKHVTLLFNSHGAGGGRFRTDQSAANRLYCVKWKVNRT